MSSIRWLKIIEPVELELGQKCLERSLLYVRLYCGRTLCVRILLFCLVHYLRSGLCMWLPLSDHTGHVICVYQDLLSELGDDDSGFYNAIVGCISPRGDSHVLIIKGPLTDSSYPLTEGGNSSPLI